MSFDKVTSALRPISEALAADGYRLEVSQSGEVTVLRISATPDACEDCLVPKEMMLRMMTMRLHDAGVTSSKSEVILYYPNESHETRKGEVR